MTYMKSVTREVTEDKPVPKGILKRMQTPKKTVTFHLPTIKEDN